ncbi:4Fe-4S single cluster domain-containing protein [Streptomyces clavuligerus]|uniref:Probable radical activating enzyme n=1 Tax=Streptomyces clavuligerus TaxID=1901 RepID=E2PXN9_STRCL|nr:4Fe-4S single cluster domain-containing protein [Streptomyces clavuligerus]ANW19125.1 radical activating enzyme [Streptomyces clavuligerus]AXU13708.1 radical SAM protein [Streptomyces clavuligerus]EFG08129.1 Probable radical activating enzyme [Streptomyces clavuligerus]MBY6303681.1 radical SAM protein [Streptomyces clavuligerus]QCS06494.1 radical SAM protein [Streptomyces clavuligerus]
MESKDRGDGLGHGAGDGAGQGPRPRIRVGDIRFPVRTLGPGARLGIWVQGCVLACPGCMSRHTWDPRGGTVRTVPELLELWRTALARGADGLTVSGGEPLDQPEGVAALLAGAARLRTAAAGPAAPADLLLYTGYEDGEIARDPARTAAVRSADALVTGRFRAAEPTGLVWRGSANQRLRPLTALGRARYAEHLERAEEPGPRLQAETADTAGTTDTADAAGAAGTADTAGAAGTAAAADAAEGEDGGNDGRLRLYGVPRSGELAALERGLRHAGIRLTRVGWRSGNPPPP